VNANSAMRRVFTAGPAFWGLAMFVAMGAIVALRILGAIDAIVSVALMLVVGPAMIVPMMRAADRLAREKGCGSPAGRRYIMRMGASSAAYTVLLPVTLWCWEHFRPGTVVTVLLALAVVLPVFAMFGAVARYLAEETDEYLRHRTVSALLWGLGAVLVLGSLWGFLETFRLVPHVPGWAVVPVWAIGMGIGQLWMGAGKR